MEQKNTETTAKEILLHAIKEAEKIALNFEKSREISLVLTKLQEAKMWAECCGGGPKTCCGGGPKSCEKKEIEEKD